MASEYQITAFDEGYRTWTGHGKTWDAYRCVVEGNGEIVENCEVNFLEGSGPTVGDVLYGHTEASKFGPKFKREQRDPGSYQPASQPANAQSATRAPAAKPQTLSREDYWLNKEARDIESQARMGRAHAQEMALRAMALLKDERNFGEDPQEDGGPNFDQIVGLWTDHFHKDVQRFPLKDGEDVPF